MNSEVKSSQRTTINLPPEDELASQIEHAEEFKDLRPLRQYKFAEYHGRKFAFDFCWPRSMVAVEVDGGTTKKGGGRHNRAKGYRKDTEKLNLAGQMGWTVYRYVSQDIYNGTALSDLKRIFAQ